MGTIIRKRENPNIASAKLRIMLVDLVLFSLFVEIRFPHYLKKIHLQVYTKENQWHCISTCFFIDCANNILSFIEAIYKILKPGKTVDLILVFTGHLVRCFRTLF